MWQNVKNPMVHPFIVNMFATKKSYDIKIRASSSQVNVNGLNILYFIQSCVLGLDNDCSGNEFYASYLYCRNYMYGGWKILLIFCINNLRDAVSPTPGGSQLPSDS